MTGTIRHRPRKRFGQNFLHDKTIIQQITQAFDPDPALAIVEIGPGRGALTLPLLLQGYTLHAIEIDTDLARSLTLKCEGKGKLLLHSADALKFDYARIQPAPLQVIGNLPYNISTPLMFHLLKQSTRIKVMLFMLQQELVDRICASANDPDYGRLSVMVQARCDVEKLFTVPAEAFSPQPKVTSALIRLIPKPGSATTPRDPVLFEQIVRQAFSQRRKTLHNALKGIVDDACLQGLAIDPGLRAENLTVNDYIRIANSLESQQNQ